MLLLRGILTARAPSPAAVLACLLLTLISLSACAPIPGGSRADGEPGAVDGADVRDGGAAVDAGAAEDGTVCADPRAGRLAGEEVPIVRSDDAPTTDAVPALIRIDRTSTTDPWFRVVEDDLCIDRVIVAAGADATLRALAAARAVIEGVPLVLEPTTALRAELVERVDASDAAGIIALAAGLLAAAQAASDPAASDPAASGGDAAVPSVVIVGEEDVAAQADIVGDAARGSIPLVLPTDPVAAFELLDELRAHEPGLPVTWAASSIEHARDLRSRLEDTGMLRWTASGSSGRSAELWLGDVRDPQGAVLSAVVAAARGAAFVAVDGAELRSGQARTERLRAAWVHPDGPVTVFLVGELAGHTSWQLDTVLTGTPSPSGGFLPLEDRRIVALYGSPDTPSLGLLGQQDDVATIQRAREFAARYEDAVDGRIVVPGLDVIATIASSAAEPTGDYSRRVPLARLRELVDLAAEAEMAVFLDLQPGRTSFLSQAQEYEELLREPHVHLALDPEWRLRPGERHLVRIGSVEAEEVQLVVDWLAALVRAERLPQKVLMLHQFTLAMLPDCDDIVIPSELIGVIHVDGQGRLVAKNRTYDVLSRGAEERWAWGWKNFTRIDVPVASPEQSIDRLPVPVVITYQ